MENNQLKIDGTVERITFRNRENGYTVIKVLSDKNLIVAAGIMPFLQEGDYVSITGEYTFHQTYGKQLKCSSVEVALPKTQSQVLRFLSSGAIRGIGPVTAEKIVSRFKDETLDIIEKEPIALTEIKGISIDKAYAISDEYKKQFGIRDIMLTLSTFSISPSEASKIFKCLGTSSVEIIKNNPYSLCSDAIGISFERAEEIAERFGILKDDSDRVAAGIIYVLRHNLSNGHTCLPKNKLVLAASRLLTLEDDIVLRGICSLEEKFLVKTMVMEGQEFVFLPEYFNAETYISNKVKTLIGGSSCSISASKLEIVQVEASLGIKFNNKQTEAINFAIQNNVFILTGGPGTGKTTTLNAIINILENRGNDIGIAAPTGRAAKRISELTGTQAKTLHRLLEVEWIENGKANFARNLQRPLDFDVVIVDEMSMVDVSLFKALLEAVRRTTKLILVGDSDQLPSIGAGNLLNDLISSGLVPSVRLDEIFRQSQDSKIVTSAHEIISGKIPEIPKDNTDIFFINSQNPFDTCEKILNLYKNRIPEVYGFSSMQDIQVLCPSRKMDAGSVNLNKLIQESLISDRKKAPECYYKGTRFVLGDKVMQTKNDYDIMWVSDNGEQGTGIFNGDIGFISYIDNKSGVVKVRYDDKTATYYFENLDLIEHAYAITIHKSQGSEFEAVIIPMVDTPLKLQYRNLLYTAITRAKKLLILIGSKTIFENMIKNDRKMLRYTALSYLLKGKSE